jgi:hypothetical protein
MNNLKHHLVLGEMKDFLTGKTIEDNHDERLRQKIARFLVEKKGYDKGDISARIPLTAAAGNKRAVLKVDFCICMLEKRLMIVKYGPGSLVTRRRPALSASRLIEPYQIPLVVVSNGIDAEVMNGADGKILGESLSAIPGKKEVLAEFNKFDFTEISPERALLESRILYAYEVDDSCACDGNICRL